LINAQARDFHIKCLPPSLSARNDKPANSVVAANPRWAANSEFATLSSRGSRLTVRPLHCQSLRNVILDTPASLGSVLGCLNMFGIDPASPNV
jgi:hypothetical protein